MEKFAIGLVMGGLVGALLVANNHKMRALVKKAQDETQAKLDAFMDEKIRMMEKGAEKAAEKAEEIVDEAKEKISKKTKKNA
ncbi:MAG: hypothetical protein IJ329_02680 [Clostridia bacterium]|nr:hypothetical protein [Clostridia bacterium]